MAMSGTLSSNKVDNNYYLNIDWSASYNVDSMTATIYINSYILQSPSTSYPNRTFRIYGTTVNNYININGVTVFEISQDSGSGTQSNPYFGYTHTGSSAANRVGYFSNWTSGPAWVYSYANFISNYVFTVPINDDGYCTFTVAANLYCSGGTMTISSTTISTTPTEVNSKLGYKTGGSWTGNGRIWHKENGTWVKKFLYRKESGSWNKK